MDQFTQFGVDPSAAKAPAMKQVGDLFNAAAYLRSSYLALSNTLLRYAPERNILSYRNILTAFC